MSKKKVINIENEGKDAKFRRIVNPRIKKLVYELKRITKMANQPNYTVYDVDAKKMLDYVMPEIESFVTLYQKIAEGETVNTNTKKEIKDVF